MNSPEVESLFRPRMISPEPLTPPKGPLSVTLMPASDRASAAVSPIPAWSSVSPEIAVMLAGIFCADSEWRVAVTMISCRAVSSAAAAAPYKAASTARATGVAARIGSLAPGTFNATIRVVEAVAAMTCHSSVEPSPPASAGVGVEPADIRADAFGWLTRLTARRIYQQPDEAVNRLQTAANQRFPTLWRRRAASARAALDCAAAPRCRGAR